MTFKKIKSFFIPSCLKPKNNPSSEARFPAVSKQISSRRLSLSDLSNSSVSLLSDLSNSLIGSNLHIFTLKELKNITQDFSKSNFLGEGGFGQVYKGFIDDRLRPGLEAQSVAVKVLDLDGKQGHREWLVSFFFLPLIYVLIIMATLFSSSFFFSSYIPSDKKSFCDDI